MCITFFMFYLFSLCASEIFSKPAKQFFLNANFRYLIIYSLPLPWICFMFYARGDLEEANWEEGFSIVFALVLLGLVVAGIITAFIFLVFLYRRFKNLNFY